MVHLIYMGATNSSVSKPDGSMSWALGVDSIKATTIASEANPNGLTRNSLAWLQNGTVRDGGITQRWGWQPLCKIHDGGVKYQGGAMYQPDAGNPYLILSIGGRIIKVDPDTCTPLELNYGAATVGQVTLLNVSDSVTTAVSGYSPLWGYFHFTTPPVGTSVTFDVSSPYTGTVPTDVIFWEGTYTITAFTAYPAPAPPANPMNPSNPDYAYFCQAEKWLVIQAGDGATLPLFWDGLNLMRSVGITNAAVIPGVPGTNQIPAATAMDYYMGRLWYAKGRVYTAGDIVGGNSGTVANGYRDAVLNVTESPLAIGGDGFIVPDNAGNIVALKHSANMNTQLGQGQLYIFTRKAVYGLTVPVSRIDWIASGYAPLTTGGRVGYLNESGAPLQTVVQQGNGATSDRSIVSVNGDLYYQSFEPAIRSLITAVRNFQQPGNIDISANEHRVWQFTDRSLLGGTSGIYFDNRLLMTCLPRQTTNGIVYQAIMPLDFVPASTLQSPTQPVWEGIYEGSDVLQLFTGDFNGKERAFAILSSRTDNSIWLWELTVPSKFQNGDNRVDWVVEFPAFNWGDEFALKRLVSAELWIDRIGSPMDFWMDYRPDGETCWKEWHRWSICAPRDTEEAGGPSYPAYPCGESHRATMTLPLPPASCIAASGRPSDIGYQFQLRLTIKGYGRIRGLLVHAVPVERKLYEGKMC